MSLWHLAEEGERCASEALKLDLRVGSLRSPLSHFEQGGREHPRYRTPIATASRGVLKPPESGSKELGTNGGSPAQETLGTLRPVTMARLIARAAMAVSLAAIATVFTSVVGGAFSSAASATVYNHCMVILQNDTGRAVPLKSAEKYSHDDWNVGNRPPIEKLNRLTWGTSDYPHINGTGAGNYWGTESGFARGCWNRVTY